MPRRDNLPVPIRLSVAFPPAVDARIGVDLDDSRVLPILRQLKPDIISVERTDSVALHYVMARWWGFTRRIDTLAAFQC